MSLSARIDREKKTVGIMIKMFCNLNHVKGNQLCPDCDLLREFAHERIDRCLFQDDKPVCSECEVHCYRKDMREKIKQIMRYAGPRMLYLHPILGLRHLIDKRRFKYIEPKVYKSNRD